MKIIITGINKGLGKSLFDLLYKATDADLICIGKSFTEQQKNLSSTRIILIKKDLSQADKINDLLNNIEDDVIFINNAASVLPIANIGSINNSQIIQTVNLNFITPSILVNNINKKAKSLTVINISSGAAHHPINNWGIYCSTKAGVEMYLNVLATQKNCIVHNFDPGVMNTKMQEDIRFSDFEQIDYFKSLKLNDQLKDTNDVAIEIFEKYIKGSTNE